VGFLLYDKNRNYYVLLPKIAYLGDRYSNRILLDLIWIEVLLRYKILKT